MGHQDGALYLLDCIAAQGHRFIVWRPAPRLSPAQLAQRARATLRLPVPQARTSPGQISANAVPSTWVGLWTWYWTTPDTWHPLSATATLDGISATVTARPKALTFQAGQGHSVSCPGPGRAWTESDGNTAPSHGGCGYVYRHTQKLVRPVVSIRWAAAWQASDGTSGQLPDLVTQSTFALRVEQIQIVNR